MNQKNTLQQKQPQWKCKKTPLFFFLFFSLGSLDLQLFAAFFFPKETEIGDLLHGQVVKFRFALPRLDPDSFREAAMLGSLEVDGSKWW